MATCTNCGCNNLKCGCKDTYFTTPPACPTPTDCPDPQPCSEVFDAQCIIYTGADIECDEDIVVTQNDSVSEALISIVDYICNLSTVAIAAGTDISVASSTVGNVTTYTITNTSPASSVTLTSAGGTETLVNDGTGAALAVKGITAGTGISVSSSATAVTIAATGPQKYVGNYNSLPGTLVITHNLNTQFVVISIIEQNFPFAAYSNGLLQDYTYEVTNANQITITDLTGMGAITATVIG
jgi:hypothetical protein